MTRVFVDAVFYLALLNPRDQYADAATEFSDGFNGEFITTCTVLAEVANGLARTRRRHLMLSLWQTLNNDPSVVVVDPDELLWLKSIELYSGRPDQTWSLTDCMSFLVMQEFGLTDAVTADHHFVQAGFNILLK